MQCTICFNEDGTSYEDFKTGKNIQVTLNADGLCHECVEYFNYKNLFLETLKNTRELVQNILQENRGKYEYDAIFFLSGGKDSTAGLIRAINKYQLNLLAYHVDKGNAYEENYDRIFNIVDKLGVDLVIQKVDKKLTSRLISFCFRNGLNPCQYCGLFIHRPVADRFVNKFKIPILITGVDLWEIQWGYFIKHLYQSNDPYLLLQMHYNPLYKSHQYFAEKFKILKYLEKTTPEESILAKKRKEFLEIYNTLERKYFLSVEEIAEYQQKIKYSIPITALEFEKKEEIIQLITDYGWYQGEHKLHEETTFTDCRIGAYSNYLLPPIKRKRLWSLRLRAGMITKEAALTEMNGKVSNKDIEKIREDYDLME